MTERNVPAIGSIAPGGRKRAVCEYKIVRPVALVETVARSQALGNGIDAVRAERTEQPRRRYYGG